MENKNYFLECKDIPSAWCQFMTKYKKLRFFEMSRQAMFWTLYRKSQDFMQFLWKLHNLGFENTYEIQVQEDHAKRAKN